MRVDHAERLRAILRPIPDGSIERFAEISKIRDVRRAGHEHQRIEYTAPNVHGAVQRPLPPTARHGEAPRKEQRRGQDVTSNHIVEPHSANEGFRHIARRRGSIGRGHGLHAEVKHHAQQCHAHESRYMHGEEVEIRLEYLFHRAIKIEFPFPTPEAFGGRTAPHASGGRCKCRH